jgi:hypothetical protein
VFTAEIERGELPSLRQGKERWARLEVSEAA